MSVKTTLNFFVIFTHGVRMVGKIGEKSGQITIFKVKFIKVAYYILNKIFS